MRWATRHYDDILLALWQHLVLVGAAMLMAFAISLLLGITTARRPRLYALVMAVTGMIFPFQGWRYSHCSSRGSASECSRRLSG